MHEEQSWRLDEHMAVYRSHLYAIVSQCADHRVHFAGNQNKVSGDRRFAPTGRLKVDGMSDTHRWRNLHFILHDLFRAGNAELIDAAVDLSTLAYDLIDLLGVNSQVLTLIASRGRSERRLAERERIMNRFGDLDRIAHRPDVHVHDSRRSMQDLLT